MDNDENNYFNFKTGIEKNKSFENNYVACV